MARRSTILGLASLQKKLDRLPKVVTAEIKASMEKVAQQIVDLAKSLVPKGRTGALRDSIGWTWGAPPRGSITLGKVARSALGKGLTLTVFAGNDEAYYARWVEFGTSAHAQGGLFEGTDHPGTAAQPYFFPAYRANKKPARRAIRKSVRQAALKVARQS
ncbi:HK97-gp10 family putative phage morphogenesis protein [Xanthobacteraceae bacterium A53D]